MVSSAVRVGVVGGTCMGGGIPQSFAAHGIDCVLVDATPRRSRERVAQLHDEAKRFAADGLHSDRMVEQVVANLRAAERT